MGVKVHHLMRKLARNDTMSSQLSCMVGSILALYCTIYAFTTIRPSAAPKDEGLYMSMLRVLIYQGRHPSKLTKIKLSGILSILRKPHAAAQRPYYYFISLCATSARKKDGLTCQPFSAYSPRYHHPSPSPARASASAYSSRRQHPCSTRRI